MAWPTSLQVALKEWATVCRALESGRQTILLRKGGIYESAGEFEVQHREFLLFPTYVHQNLKMLKQSEHAGFESRSEEPGEVVLSDAGVVLSEIGLGGWLTFGNAIEASAGRAIFDKAFDCGINFFDTANAYARGQGEEAFAQCLSGRRRESYVLATKVYFPMGDGPNDKGLSRKHIMEQCHASLKRLRTDYID